MDMAVDLSSVTGLVLHFRTPERTLTCLQSLRDEGVRRVVVVDNSEDGGHSVSQMHRGLDNLLSSGLDVVLIPSIQNLGFARAVGVGLDYVAMTFGGSVLLINSDAWLEKNSLRAMLPQLASAALVVPRVSNRLGGARLPLFGFYHALFAVILRHHVWGSIFHPSGCCLLVRADEVRSDLFDTDFFFYGEDAMLGFDLQRRGIAVADCREAVVVHSGSASSKNGSMFYEYHMNRAHWLLAHKLSRNRFEYAIFVLMRCITLPMRALVRSVRLRSLVPWRGLLVATIDVVRGRCRSFTPTLVTEK
jgi:GT2 family glycosyltransferase